MSSRRFCDICTKDITKEESYVAGKWFLGERGEYCRKCWVNRKNWPEIHKVERKKQPKCR